MVQVDDAQGTCKHMKSQCPLGKRHNEFHTMYRYGSYFNLNNHVVFCLENRMKTTDGHAQPVTGEWVQ